MRHKKKLMYKNYIKRPFDFLLSTFAFVIVSPIFLFVTILLAIANKGKPFFIQSRPGKNEKIFKIIKFKTMTDQMDSDGKLLPDDKRLTALGSFVRKTSLDEIPQLLNVIKGDMSLIGPRPLLIQYLPLYNKKQKRRHEIKPGITGWAQVNGRNTVGWKEKFEYDVWYVDHLTFLLDIKIIFMTVLKIFKSEGISADNQATVKYFEGND
jgi:lipopolysaccharide/colanic/teichoic acid biosynthesis glycosyltransferase